MAHEVISVIVHRRHTLVLLQAARVVFSNEIKLGLILLTRYQPFWVDGLNSMRQQYYLEKQGISFCWMISKNYSPNTNLFLECLPG